MQDQDKLFNFFKMTKQNLQTLSLSEAQQYLYLLHSSQKQKQISESRILSKKIKRLNNKKAYRQYVKANISNIIRRSINRVLNHKKGSPYSWKNAQLHDHIQSHRNKPPKRHLSKLEVKIEIHQNIEKILVQDKNQQFKCPICLQFLIHPALTKCGHTFCFQCLDESLLSNNNCPNCRQNLKGSEIILSHCFDRLAKKTEKDFYSQQQYNLYKERINKYQQWMKLRILDYSTFYKGQIVDIRDTECIWCQGTILDIYYQDNQPNSILVHFNKWNQIYNEVIDLPSCRLAPYNFFSGRVDIPRYNLSQQDNNLRGSVISGARLNEINQNRNVNVIEISQSSNDNSSSEENSNNENEDGNNDEDEDEQQQRSQQNNIEENINIRPGERIFQNWHFIRLINPNNNSIRFRIDRQRVINLQLPRPIHFMHQQFEQPVLIQQNPEIRLLQQAEGLQQQPQSNNREEQQQSKQIEDQQQKQSENRGLQNNQHDI